ncbi:PG0541 family transporter-associated protein [uncultured Ilyobacter sp.]|uniref:PG0541 family transporter-associated protein n=1 Tax=uncultured Ilyobacter sp. TaxID=544433 RepID=UPI0029F490AC|nr:PG0541 family transporter-associated protein [uncultured Ilyobacter sp.]
MEEYKLLRIICDSSLEEELVEILMGEGIEEYTVFPSLKGSWEKTKKHLDSHVWPGTDSVIFTVLEKDQCKKLVEKFRIKKESMDYYITFKIVVSSVELYLK